jgi:predicted naringenin-chalcone synthase
MDVRIVGLGTANPPLRVSQEEIYRAYMELVPLSDKGRDLLRQILLDNKSIAFRHMGMDDLSDAVSKNSQDELIARYQKFAIPVAVEAASKALNQAGLTPGEVDAIVTNTCTGYLCPGLTSYVAEALSLRKNVKPFDLQGMGCGGAIPALETAYDLLHTYPDANVLTLSVEICTATIVFSEDPAILVSNCIFGDGAAATVLTNHPGTSGLRLKHFAAGLFPEYRQHLHYRTEDSRLRNVLSQRVPTLGAKCSKQVVEDLLAQSGIGFDDIDRWVVHTGGEKVLDAFQRAVDLPDEALIPSRTVRGRSPQPGDLIVMCSFGAGFSAFATLLEVL